MFKKISKWLLNENKLLKFEIKLTACSFLFLFPLILRIFEHHTHNVWGFTNYAEETLLALSFYLVFNLAAEFLLPFSPLVKVIIFSVVATYMGGIEYVPSRWFYYVKYLVYPGLLIYFTLYKKPVLDYLHKLANKNE